MEDVDYPGSTSGTRVKDRQTLNLTDLCGLCFYCETERKGCCLLVLRAVFIEGDIVPDFTFSGSEVEINNAPDYLRVRLPVLFRYLENLFGRAWGQVAINSCSLGIKMCF